MIYNMGQAIPDAKRTGWYTNQPIPGLILELRAMAVGKNANPTYGFTVIEKNSDVFQVFMPLGNYKSLLRRICG